MVADGVGDETRGNRRAVIRQDRHEPYRINAVLVDDQSPQLAVAVLLDDVDEIVVGDEAPTLEWNGKARMRRRSR